MLTQLVSPSLADLSEVQYLLKYAKYLGPSWFRRVLTSLVPSPTVQRLKKAVDDVEAESKKILSSKRAGLKAGDKEIAHDISEKKDIMSILRAYFTINRESYEHRTNSLRSSSKYDRVRNRTTSRR